MSVNVYVEDLGSKTPALHVLRGFDCRFKSEPAPVQAGRPPVQGCNLELATFLPELATFPPELATLLAEQAGRLDHKTLHHLIIRLCAWQPLTGEQLATLLKKDRHYLRNKHLVPMVRDGHLALRYPESAKHPHQAYLVLAGSPEAGHD